MAKERLKSPRARLFVALELPEEVRAQIVAWQARELADPALRPVRPESLHMTLVFLGYQAEKDLERIAEAALGVEALAPEVELLPDPVGVPRGRRPRLYALDAPSEGAVALQGEVERRLVAARFHEAEKRPFRGAGEAGGARLAQAGGGGEAAGSPGGNTRSVPSDPSGALQVPLAADRRRVRTDG